VPLYTNLCVAANFACSAAAASCPTPSGTCAVCDTSTSLPSAPCPSGAPTNVGYDVTKPACGGVANYGTFACDPTCTTLGLQSTGPVVYQLCL